MKRFVFSTLFYGLAATMLAQTMNVKMGNVTYAFYADQTGEMVYGNGGHELTIQGTTFDLDGVDRIFVDNAVVADNTVNINYSGTQASLVVAGNIAGLLSIDTNNAHVVVVQDDAVVEEITYVLSGASADGSFTMDGNLKATVVLNGLSLSSTMGAAIDIENGKRIDIVVADGTTNTLTDYASGLQKACFFVNGHAEFSGGGTLNITGNAKHAYRSDEYTKLKKTFTGTMNVLKAASDGLHVEQYLEMNGGTLVIDNVGADAIDVAATNDATDEFNGQIFINGGTITATTSANDIKTLKCDSDLTITDGTLKLTANGDGSKAISTKGALTVSGGTIEALALGDIFDKDLATESKPNGVKASGAITINGGAFYCVANNKAFNTDATTDGFVINGGTVMGIGALKASAAATGTQGCKTYTRVKISGGTTLSYGTVSYTVPANFASDKAYVLVSPY